MCVYPIPEVCLGGRSAGLGALWAGKGICAFAAAGGGKMVGVVWVSSLNHLGRRWDCLSGAHSTHGVSADLLEGSSALKLLVLPRGHLTFSNSETPEIAPMMVSLQWCP